MTTTTAAPATAHPIVTGEAVRDALRARQEIALLDVREEDPFAQSHPLWAANLPYGQIELSAWRRIPRRDTPIVVYDDGEGLAAPAATRLRALGYTDVSLLDGGLTGWRDGGGELFRDVNVPSKSFGELVEAKRHTPSLSAREVHDLLENDADVVVLDARTFNEYHTMNIPGSTSVPGAELVLRVRELAPNPATRVIVNCAGRTRSIIGTQSLVNAGIPNPVSALRNGTIGWTLEGLSLQHGQQRRHATNTTTQTLAQARADARAVADRAGVQRITWQQLHTLFKPGRTTYRFDVRTPEEYAAGHLPGFLSTPGGQLVQETDHHAPVRGAQLVLADDLDVRADMSASWLAQMGWDVYVLEGTTRADFTETGLPTPAYPPLPPAGAQRLDAARLHAWLSGISAPAPTAADAPAPVVLDLALGVRYAAGHIPGAWFALRSQWDEVLAALPANAPLVLTSPDGQLARHALPEVQARASVPVYVLEGGTAAWQTAGFALVSGDEHLAVPRSDRYRRPYEGTDNPVAAMQGYLDWEYGLVEQLGRDGTHHFVVA